MDRCSLPFLLVAAIAFGFNAAADCSRLLSADLLIPEDAITFQKISDQKNLFIVVMAPNPDSLRFVGKPGYAAKTPELKACKSAKSGRTQDSSSARRSYSAMKKTLPKTKDS